METYEISFYDQRKNALIEEIIADFDGVSREGGVSLSEAEVIDDYGDAGERAAARARDTETCWLDVPDEDLGRCWALHFLDPIGFRYYLPYFLLSYLHQEDLDEGTGGGHEVFNSNNFDSLDFQLAAGFSKAGIAESYQSKFEALMPIQSRAVAHFLEFEAECADAWKKEAAKLDAERKRDKEFGKRKENNARKEAEKLARMSPEQLKELEERDRQHEIYNAQFDSPNNEYRYALEKYWGRFL